MKTQCERLGALLTRKRGLTSMEIIQAIGTVCPHKRLADLKAMGWTITKREVLGTSYHRYFGQPPKAGV